MKTISEMRNFIYELDKLEGQAFVDELLENADAVYSDYGDADIKFRVKTDWNIITVFYSVPLENKDIVSVMEGLDIKDADECYYINTQEVFERLLIRDKDRIIREMEREFY